MIELLGNESFVAGLRAFGWPGNDLHDASLLMFGVVDKINLRKMCEMHGTVFPILANRSAKPHVHALHDEIRENFRLCRLFCDDSDHDASQFLTYLLAKLPLAKCESF
jgi:hypothetical protein